MTVVASSSSSTYLDSLDRCRFSAAVSIFCKEVLLSGTCTVLGFINCFRSSLIDCRDALLRLTVLPESLVIAWMEVRLKLVALPAGSLRAPFESKLDRSLRLVTRTAGKVPFAPKIMPFRREGSPGLLLCVVG